MILADTNVVSEPLRKAPEPCVAEWLDAQALETLHLSAITVAELRFGVWPLPAGHRRNRLHKGLEEQILPMFAGRVMLFDLAASQVYAELMAKAPSKGRQTKTRPTGKLRLGPRPTGENRPYRCGHADSPWLGHGPGRDGATQRRSLPAETPMPCPSASHGSAPRSPIKH